LEEAFGLVGERAPHCEEPGEILLDDVLLLLLFLPFLLMLLLLLLQLQLLLVVVGVVMVVVDVVVRLVFGIGPLLGLGGEESTRRGREGGREGGRGEQEVTG
jgi:hypothetical protein